MNNFVGMFQGGWISTAVCRVLQGLSQACIVPGIHTSLGKWAPLQERGRIAAFVYGGRIFLNNINSNINVLFNS